MHETSTRERIIVFARFPEPGRAKTRLIPAIGPESAARLHEDLARYTLDVARETARRRACEIEVRFAGGDSARMAACFGDDLTYVAQQGDDLGERLDQAVSAAFASGCQRTLVIGSDCPSISVESLCAGFAALEQAGVAFGPAADGGYYLVALAAPQSELFRGIEWSSERTLAQSLDVAKRIGLRIKLLETLADVDQPEDLLVVRGAARFHSEALPRVVPGRLSVIVPTRNEAANIQATLDRVASARAGDSGNVEVIVVDGDSTDATVEIAQRAGTRVVQIGRRGRGRQMNAGAAIASGEWLLFLHADARVPEQFDSHIGQTLAAGAIAGAFRLQIDAPELGLRWIERAANLRSRFLQTPYGDQGLFLSAATFWELGGFPAWPLMEDYELCRRLRRRGRIRLAPASMVVSARRWQKLGLVRTTLVNQLCVAAFHLGASPERLARWYASALSRGRS